MSSLHRILNTFKKATPELVAAGTQWYPDALAYAKGLDRNTERAVGVIAALSPRQHWETNKAGAAKILKAAQHSSTIVPTVAGTYRNIQKAWDIANGADPVMVLTPTRPNRWLKVPRFYANILGNTELVTVDIWAARVAIDKAPDVVAGSLYKRIEEMYQRAASVVGLVPRDLQAICWLTIQQEWS
jgi:hypothetical protein